MHLLFAIVLTKHYHYHQENKNMKYLVNFTDKYSCCFHSHNGRYVTVTYFFFLSA